MKSNNDDEFRLGLPKGDRTYEVGYGKPPKATRFKAGQSGNPKGRPKGSRNAMPKDPISERLKSLVLEEAYRPIQIRDGGTLLKIPAIQAALRSLSLQAAQGKQARAASPSRPWSRASRASAGEIETSSSRPTVEYQIDARGQNRRSPSTGTRGTGIPAAPG